MDHVPLPGTSRSKYPPIKCLCAAEGVDNTAIHIRCLSTFEFTKSQFARGSNALPSIAIAAPFLQAWLWFGLFERIFTVVGVAFDPTEFVTVDHSVGLRLSTYALHRYLWYCVAAESQTSEVVKQQHLRLINEYLDEVFDVVNCFSVKRSDANASPIQDTSSFGPFVEDDTSHVLLAIIVLAEALDHALLNIYGPSLQRGQRVWNECLSVRLSLLEAGWCINELSWLTYQFPICRVTSLLYLSHIDRHVLGKDHRTCKLESCVYKEIDYTTYRPLHTSIECGCADLTLRYDLTKRMDRILCRNGIPLITFTSEDIFGSKLAVQALHGGDMDTLYVAISHVWSDRLGNIRENALPACQLKRLQSEVNALYSSHSSDIPFWIDTICVPREPTTRSLAINSMRHVYGRADKVLVLDSSLRTMNSLVAPEELIVRIAIAPWSTRLWTYHEGALAPRIYFQLSDCAVVGDTITQRYYSEYKQAPNTVRVQELLRFGNNKDMNRALVRAMALDESGQDFLDLQSEVEKVTSLNALEQKVQDPTISELVDIIPRPDDKDWTRFGKMMEETFLELKGVDLDNANEETKAAAAKILTLTKRTLSVRARTAQVYESALKKAEQARVWESQAERRKLNNLGGLPGRQIPPAGLHLDVPTTWLEDKPQDSDKRLAEAINRITPSGVSSQYWLRAFDPIQAKGTVAYGYLRTVFKRLRLNMSTDSVPKHQQIRETVEALIWRTTSWVGDEAICLAIILGMDVAKVQAAQGRDRMKVLAEMWHEVPVEFVFSRLKRMQSDSFKWMPQSVLGGGLNSPIARLTGKQHAYPSSRGLCFEAPGWLFKSTSQSYKNRPVAFSVSEKWYIAVIHEDAEERSWDEIDGLLIAVLSKDTLIKRRFRGSNTGIVAKVVAEEADMIYLTHLFCVRIAPVEKLDDLNLVYQSRVTAEGQKWCIG